MKTSKFNLSEIMSNAHKLFNNNRAKYSTFSLALKGAWHLAKSRIAREERRAEVEAWNAAQAKEAEEKAIRIAENNAKNEAERAARLAKASTIVTRSNAEIEAECRAYGYGLGSGTYCGD